MKSLSDHRPLCLRRPRDLAPELPQVNPQLRPGQRKRNRQDHAVLQVEGHGDERKRNRVIDSLYGGGDVYIQIPAQICVFSCLLQQCDTLQ